MIGSIISVLQSLLSLLAGLTTIAFAVIGYSLGARADSEILGTVLGAILGFILASVVLAIPALLLRINQNLEQIRELLATSQRRQPLPSADQAELATLEVRTVDGKYYVREFSFASREEAVAKARELSVLASREQKGS
jgi:hypothetical protein